MRLAATGRVLAGRTVQPGARSLSRQGNAPRHERAANVRFAATGCTAAGAL